MKTNVNYIEKTFTILALLALTGFASQTWAADPVAPSDMSKHDMSKMDMNPSKEDRAKMAAAHAQMADCLRSDQEFTQCRDALHKECKSVMGDSCSGMEHGKDMHKGMKHKH